MPAEEESRRSVFPGLADRSTRRQQVVSDLVEARRRHGLTQTEVAAQMGTSQSAVARLEAGEADVRLSTLDRYAAALGARLEWRLTAEQGRGAAKGGDAGAS